MADPKALPALPVDAKAHVEALPDWLRDSAAEAFQAVAPPSVMQKAERERAETDRLTQHTRLVDQVVRVLRGELGRSKEAQPCIASITALLCGRQPRQAELATLITCESIIREAKQRIRNNKKPPPAGRGAL